MATRTKRPAGFDYQRYLASREWALLKEQVRERSNGHCEHCRTGPYQETHHATYERIGREDLGDIMAVCRECHAFLSGKTEDNPWMQGWHVSRAITDDEGQRVHLWFATAAEISNEIGKVSYKKCLVHPILRECLACKYAWAGVHDFLVLHAMWSS